MFVYERENSLNLTFKGSLPVENPDVVIKGFKDGATLTVNGTTYGSGSEEFEGKAQTLVYQKDGKLVITFRGVAGMSDPEITIDDIGSDCYAIVVSGESVTLSVVGDKVEVVAEEVHEPSDEDDTPAADPEEVEDLEETVEE